MWGVRHASTLLLLLISGYIRKTEEAFPRPGLLDNVPRGIARGLPQAGLLDNVPRGIARGLPQARSA